jgi:type II secretory pathway pseudopilin PulG
VQLRSDRPARPLLDVVQAEDLRLDFAADHHARPRWPSRPGAWRAAAAQEAVAAIRRATRAAEAAGRRGSGTRPSGRTEMAVVFMVRGRSPRHRFNQDRFRRWTWMRYGIGAATALRSMPPLPGSVVPPPEIALPVAALRRTPALVSTLRRAAAGAVAVAPVAPRAHHDPGAAAGAHEHPMAVHGGASSPSTTGQTRRSPATLLRANVAADRGVCRRKLGG